MLLLCGVHVTTAADTAGFLALNYWIGIKTSGGIISRSFMHMRSGTGHCKSRVAYSSNTPGWHLPVSAEHLKILASQSAR